MAKRAHKFVTMFACKHESMEPYEAEHTNRRIEAIRKQTTVTARNTQDTDKGKEG